MKILTSATVVFFVSFVILQYRQTVQKILNKETELEIEKPAAFMEDCDFPDLSNGYIHNTDRKISRPWCLKRRQEQGVKMRGLMNQLHMTSEAKKLRVLAAINLGVDFRAGYILSLGLGVINPVVKKRSEKTKLCHLQDPITLNLTTVLRPYSTSVSYLNTEWSTVDREFSGEESCMYHLLEDKFNAVIL